MTSVAGEAATANAAAASAAASAVAETATTRTTGEATAARVRRLRALLVARRLDAVLVTDPFDVRYLSGFTGDDTCLVVGRDVALICTDSRYWAQVADEVRGFTLEKTERLLDDASAAIRRDLGENTALGFQGARLSYADHRRLRHGHAGRLRDVGGAVTKLREVKDAGEVERIRRAARLTDEALRAVVATGLVGRTERDVAWQIGEELHKYGAEGLAFASIVAAGEWGALPHAAPRDRPIGRGELVVIDTGARVEGYCSDITRTFATGELDGELRRVYETVLCAQLTGLAALRGGIDGKAVDAAARAVIDAAGYGERFGHGTGHGVGLEVHEAPRLGRLHGDPLAPGMVATVEPGIYLEGRAGVRIEDTVLVTPDGCELLTGYPKELQVAS